MLSDFRTQEKGNPKDVDETHQWAAVKTCLFVTKDPPHWWSHLVLVLKPPREASQGTCLIETSVSIPSSGGGLVS